MSAADADCHRRYGNTAEHGCELSAGQPRCGQEAKQPDTTEQPLSAAACLQPGAVASLGRGGVRAGAQAGQADLSVDRLLDLPLVPRDGARVLRERRDRRDHEQPFHQHQGRPRRTPGHR